MTEERRLSQKTIGRKRGENEWKEGERDGERQRRRERRGVSTSFYLGEPSKFE